MSLIVTGLAVAGGILIGRVIAAGFLKREGEDPPPPAKPAAQPHQEGEEAVRKDEAGVAIAGFPCNLGDVVLRSSGEEAWLAGALVLSEQAPVSILFVSPDAGGDRFVFVRAQPSVELVWLTPLREGELPLGAEPPNAIELGTTRFERTRRLPLRARRAGTGAPDVGEQVVLGEYASTGADRLVVLVAQGRALGWRGELLESGTYDVLPGGKATLEG